MNPSFMWVIPPLAGAVIGYVTNAVAIKMLFRPLREIRIFGIRLPFTPGILPRQRHKLADNIGAMVEKQLITPEILIARFQQEDVRTHIGDSIGLYMEKILTAPIDTGKLPFLNRSIREILGSESSSLEKTLTVILEEQIQKSAPQAVSQLAAFLETNFPLMAESFIRFLEKSEIHLLLESNGGIFLNNAILKLNVFQRFFLSAGQYDKTLHDRMPEIIDDLIDQIKKLLEDRSIQTDIIKFLTDTVYKQLMKQESQERIAHFLSGTAKAFLDRPIGEILQIFLTGNQRSLEETGEPRSLGRLLSINQGKKDRFVSFIRDKFLALAEEQSPVILKTINVKTLVSDRINSLDMLSVEHIVLDVMANQFKWINIFGAILGALIGLFQPVFSLLFR
jgi:uncharacterized membrane protein YheB (UPF0754 family)